MMLIPAICDTVHAAKMWVIIGFFLSSLLSSVRCVTPSSLNIATISTPYTPFSTPSSGDSLNLTTTKFTLTDLKLSIPPSTVWKCPHITSVPGVSCLCDYPHTLRCRGRVESSGALNQIVTILKTQYLEENQTIGISLLDLDLHQLGQLEPGRFENLKLPGLVISTASLSSLPPQSFKGLELTLAALGLPSNKMTSVPIEALKILKKLQRLDLSYNNLTILPSRAFPTLLMLHDLNLSGNDLRELKSDVFVTLPRLKLLNLSNNKLDAEQLNEKSLRGLRMLNTLHLSHNLLKGSLTSNFIKGALKLTHLDLSQNELTSIKRNALEFCPDLEYLDLSYNKIDIIEDHSFHKLPHLKHLEIAHNAIVSVSGYSFAYIPKLQYLNLADNSLRTLTADLLHFLPNLQNLDLAANDITNLQVNVFNSTPFLQHLSLSDNPLQCDCEASWFREWLINNKDIPKEEKVEAVCITPQALENAPLFELESKELKCSEDSYEYYHDYYHDGATLSPDPPIRFSSAEILLLSARWLNKGIELVWQIDEQALPYKCHGVFIYEQVKDNNNQNRMIPAERINRTCNSDTSANPYKVRVVIDGSNLKTGNTYMYCLILLEEGSSDMEELLPGCSEPLLLSTPKQNQSLYNNNLKVDSLVAGSVEGALVVHTRIDKHSMPCTYTVVIISGEHVVASRQLNCTEARHTISSLLHNVEYIACVSPDDYNVKTHETYKTIEHRLHEADNVAKVLDKNFLMCTSPVLLEDSRTSSWIKSPWFTLLFTLPVLALIILMYILGRRVWKGGGMLWKWDPRASKSTKYFLYTGDNTTPTASLDPIPAGSIEHTTRV